MWTLRDIAADTLRHSPGGETAQQSPVVTGEGEVNHKVETADLFQLWGRVG